MVGRADTCGFFCPSRGNDFSTTQGSRKGTMMRKGLVLVVASMLAIAVTGSAGAAFSLLDFTSAVDALKAVDPTIEAPPNDPSKDFAVGGFQGTEGNNVGFSAHSGSLGQDPTGHLSETSPHFFPPGSSSTFQGRFRVTCLAVVGNQAAIGLVPTDAASNDELREFVFAVRDNGLPNGVGDQYAFVQEPAATCAAFVTDAFFVIERGNILVHDAVPVP